MLVDPSLVNLASPFRLLDQVWAKIRFKHYCIRTEQAYTDWIKRFIRHLGKLRSKAVVADNIPPGECASVCTAPDFGRTVRIEYRLEGAWIVNHQFSALSSGVNIGFHGKWFADCHFTGVARHLVCPGSAARFC